MSEIKKKKKFEMSQKIIQRRFVQSLQLKPNGAPARFINIA